jgi:hypothetical protein
MAEEFDALNLAYYANQLRDSNKYIDSHRLACIALEQFLSDLLFKKDLKRVIYSTPEISFRKRIQLMDTAQTENLQYNYLTLDLPYASYYRSGEIEEDDRPWTQQAAESITGVYSTDIDRLIRYNAYKCEYEATIMYSRRDDVRLAEQLLYWEKSPSYPIRYIATVRWRGYVIDIPLFFTLDKIETNVQYKESDFLSKSRIFPIKTTFTLRSYQVLINNIDKVCHLPIRFIPNSDDWDDGTTAYIVEEALLLWASEKFDLISPSQKIPNRNYADVSETLDKYFKIRFKTDNEGKPSIPANPSKESIENDIDMDNYYKIKLSGLYDQSKVININLIKKLTLKKENLLEQLENINNIITSMRNKMPPYDLMDSTDLWKAFKKQKELQKKIENKINEIAAKITAENQKADNLNGEKDIILNYYTEDELKTILGKIPNAQTNDIIRGYFDEDPQIALNICEFTDITPHSFTLRFQVKPADELHFRYLRVIIPNHDDVIVWDCKRDIDEETGKKQETKSVLLEGLYPCSEYACKIIVGNDNGGETLINMIGITSDDETNLAPSPEKINKRKGNSLIGFSF